MVINKRQLSYIKKNYSTAFGLDFTLGSYSKGVEFSYEKTKKISKINKRPGLKTLTTHLTSESIMGRSDFFCLRPYKHTKLIYIDIDKRNQYEGKTTREAFDALVSLIGKPFYYETSTDEDYHLVFELSDFLTDKAKSSLEVLLKREHRSIIEVVRSKQVIRLPFSLKYRGGAQYLSKGEYKQVSGPGHLVKVFAKLRKSNSPLRIPSFLLKANLTGTKVKAICSEEKPQPKTEADIISSCEYGRGTRHRFQPKIAFHIIRNKGTFEDFMSLCEICDDGTSKDMKLSDSKKVSVLKNVWNHSTRKFDNKFELKSSNLSDDGLSSEVREIHISDDHYLPDKYYNIFEKLIKKLHKKQNPRYRDERLKTTTQDTLILIEGIVNLKIYRRRKGFQYKEKDLLWLNEGMPLQRQLLQELCAKLKITKRIAYQISFLKEVGFLKAISKEIDGQHYTHSYKGKRHVKHYVICNYKKLLERLEVINKFTSNEYFNKDMNRTLFNFIPLITSKSNIIIKTNSTQAKPFNKYYINNMKTWGKEELVGEFEH